MASKGTYLAIAGIGGVFVWSGLKGKSISAVFRDLVSGRNPQTSTAANTIQPINAQDPSVSNAVVSYGYGSAGNVSVTPPSNSSEIAWIKSLLKGLGAPQNSANINSISSWIAHEGPWGTQGKNNPLNTKLWMPGATNFYQGVKNYPTVTIGLVATILTLRSGYPNIISRLKSGQGLCGWHSAEFSKWSGGGYDSVC